MADIRAPLRHSGLRLNQLRNQMPPLRAPILTTTVVSASVTSVRMRCCSGRHRSTSGLLHCVNRIHRMHRIHGGADDANGLLIAALMALAHANRQ